MHNTEEFNQRLNDCREIYLKHGGGNHALIEKEMRELGYRDFHRRNLYRRFERGYCKPGWIETYGWNSLLKKSRPSASDDGLHHQPLFNADEGDGADKTDKNNFFDPSNPPDLLRSALKTPPRLPEFEEFKDWLKRTWPEMEWEWKHQVYIYKHLKRITDGDSKRLMIFMPPRHGKSELVTVRYAAYMLKQDPSMNIIVGSYNQKLANRFSRKIRNALAEDRAVSHPRPVFNADQADGADKTDKNNFSDPSNPPDPLRSASKMPQQNAARPDWFVHTRAKNSEAEWETSAGGGVRAVGMGAGVTGYGAQLIIIDDPVKSRAEAESETLRDKVWNWFNDDIYTRLAPDGKIILIQTRWHEDDLAGRLLKESQEEGSEQWEVISLPALAESHHRSFFNADEADGADKTDKEFFSDPPDPPDPLRSALKIVQQYDLDVLGRREGEALCPRWFDEKALHRIRRKLGTYSFTALYQQRPTPAEGGLFKRTWFRKVDAAPPNLKWKRGYDLGISKNAGSDYTASLRVAYDSAGNMYIDGGFRRRIEYPEQRRYILGRIQSESNTEHGIELSANGNAVVQDLRKETITLGRALRGVKVAGDKVTNALPWIALAEEGKVFLVRGPWNTDFIEEAASFPSGTHDDQIDATSIAVKMHRQRGGRLYVF